MIMTRYDLNQFRTAIERLKEILTPFFSDGDGGGDGGDGTSIRTSIRPSVRQLVRHTFIQKISDFATVSKTGSRYSLPKPLHSSIEMEEEEREEEKEKETERNE